MRMDDLKRTVISNRVSCISVTPTKRARLKYQSAVWICLKASSQIRPSIPSVACLQWDRERSLAEIAGHLQTCQSAESAAAWTGRLREAAERADRRHRYAKPINALLGPEAQVVVAILHGTA